MLLPATPTGMAILPTATTPLFTTKTSVKSRGAEAFATDTDTSVPDTKSRWWGSRLLTSVTAAAIATQLEGCGRVMDTIGNGYDSLSSPIQGAITLAAGIGIGLLLPRQIRNAESLAWMVRTVYECRTPNNQYLDKNGQIRNPDHLIDTFLNARDVATRGDILSIISHSNSPTIQDHILRRLHSLNSNPDDSENNKNKTKDLFLLLANTTTKFTKGMTDLEIVANIISKKSPILSQWLRHSGADFDIPTIAQILDKISALANKENLSEQDTAILCDFLDSVTSIASYNKGLITIGNWSSYFELLQENKLILQLTINNASNFKLRKIGKVSYHSRAFVLKEVIKTFKLDKVREFLGKTFANVILEALEEDTDQFTDRQIHQLIILLRKDTYLPRSLRVQLMEKLESVKGVRDPLPE